MNTEIEKIIINHDFVELSAEQKKMVNEWAASEEEFVTMKQIIASAPLLDANVVPSSKLKASLMDTFATTYSSGAAVASGGPIVQKKGNKKVIYMWFRTGAAVAAVILAVFLVYPLFNSDDTANLVAENKVTNKDQTKSPVKAKETQKKVEVNIGESTPSSQQEVGYLAGEIVPAPVSELQVTPTTGPNDGEAFASADEVLRIEVDDFVLEMFDHASGMSFSAPATTTTTGFSNANGVINANSGDAFTFGKADADSHSDRLATADLPEHTRPIIQDRPELLDLLHTSF